MPNKEIATITKIEQNIFLSPEKFVIPMTEAEYAILVRYQAAFVHWNQRPDLRESQIVNYLIDNHSVSKSQAYRDLPIIKKLCGNVQKTSKDWLRNRITEIAFSDHEKANKLNQMLACAALIDKIGKYNRLHEPDGEDINWDEIEHPDFEPSNDVIVLDEKLYDPEMDSKRAAARAKYMPKPIEDTSYQEVPDE